MHEATLTLGLPHTNRWGFAEHLLLMHAGHIHWTAIAHTIGVPLSRLRTSDGRPVYATFFFIEEDFPDHAALNTFGLDDTVRFRLEQRAYKRTAVEGQLIFDRADRFPALADDPSALTPAAARGRHPYVRFGNIFITPGNGNRRLRVTAPVEGDFSSFRVLPNEENPYQITRAAAAASGLGLLEDRWRPATADAFDAIHALDADRDTNGAGLIYFANYIAFMNAAEQAAAATSPVATVRESDGRIVRQRRVAFYGNASPSDRIRTRVSLFHDPAQPDLVAARYAIHRQDDDELICLSEAVKRSVRV
jgi:probable biosynthetic protein (TIGR04098 family)